MIFPSSLIYHLVLRDISMAYVQRYVDVDITNPSVSQVVGGQLYLHSLCAEEVRCLSLMVITLTHCIYDEWFFSYPLMHHIDSLVHRPRLIRLSSIFCDSFVLLWIVGVLCLMGGLSSCFLKSYVLYFLTCFWSLDLHLTTSLPGQ
jgi:hypothetical protein